MEKFLSRKLIVTVGTALLTAANDAFGLGLSSETILELVALAASYIVGQATVDAFKKGA